MLPILLWCGLCLGFDLRQRRIPNWLLIAGLGAFVLALALGRPPLPLAPADPFVGVFAAALLTLPGFLWGRLGAGDVKLLLVIGLMGGLYAVLSGLLLGSLGALIYAAANALLRRPDAAAALPLGGFAAVGFAGYLLIVGG